MSLPIFRPTHELGDHLWSIAIECYKLHDEATERGFSKSAREFLSDYGNRFAVAESHVARCRLGYIIAGQGQNLDR